MRCGTAVLGVCLCDLCSGHPRAAAVRVASFGGFSFAFPPLCGCSVVLGMRLCGDISLGYLSLCPVEDGPFAALVTCLWDELSSGVISLRSLEDGPRFCGLFDVGRTSHTKSPL